MKIRWNPKVFLLFQTMLLVAALAPATLLSLELNRIENDEPGAFRLTWPSAPGHAYNLQFSLDLDNWKTAPGFPTTAEAESLQHEFASSDAKIFFQVIDLGLQIEPLEVFFSVAGPTGEEIDLTLEEKLKELLELAEPGSEVLAAVYTWSRRNMAEAFIEACERGVDVRLLIGSEYHAVQMLKDALPEGDVVVCRDAGGTPNGCHGGGINHNKFFLFSSLSDGSKDVVVQSSANLTNPQIRSNNNMVVVRGDTGLYNAYHLYWHDLYQQEDNLHYYRQVTGDTGLEVFFFPRNEGNSQSGENDTIVEILDTLVPSETGESRIHVGMAFFTNARRGIAHRLAELQDEGFAVQVIVNPNNTGDQVFDILEGAGVSVVSFPRVHSKYMLIEHGWGRQKEQIVLTGSHNFTSPALRSNDEVLLRIDDPDIYEAFLEDWHDMRDHPLASEYEAAGAGD